MAGGKEPIEVRFRLFDGTDIGPTKYDPSTTVSALKEFILARWPQVCQLVKGAPVALRKVFNGEIQQFNLSPWIHIWLII
jgi:hypothetical protein